MPFEYDPRRAVRALSRGDAVMARLIREIGPFALELRDEMTPFQALLRAIVYQQLSGAAAGTIHRRLCGLYPGRRGPGPRQLLSTPDDTLRAAGLSRGKVASARDLAEKTLARVVPTRERLRAMDDDAIVERLIQVRGIGRWTVEMLLIFNLGRPDVFPVDDLGVRRGYAHAHGTVDLPSPADLRTEGERWRPHRSVASWYLWRASERPPLA
ncbi:MAG: DNA-3-methyladenine glycosylase 2 family protein [Ectothiorhodospiraceae bacterium]|nr:DNA-3-methyladenine glycosylase 2 family protein [Chromatiales bacterium]MCP5154755.1 DNA-3-methyladenine glycosylase 2 family protein [Ectothiorhodospiraceae bacterium]